MGTILEGSPSELVAGDSATWRRSLVDYPAGDGWTLKYTLVGQSEVHSFDATADGDDFLVTLAAADTASWASGVYSLQEYVLKGTERHTLAVKRLRIDANLAMTGPTGADTRSHAQKVLDSINAWLESRASVAGAMTFNGRSISHYPINDLLALRDRLRREVALEAADGVRRGHPVHVSL